MRVKLILVIVLVLTVVLFTLQNTEQVEISFLLWNFTTSRALMIFVLLIVGFLAGWLVGSLQSKRGGAWR